MNQLTNTFNGLPNYTTGTVSTAAGCQWLYPQLIGGPQVSKTDTAIKVLNKLIEKNLISADLSVKDFLALVSELSEIL